MGWGKIEESCPLGKCKEACSRAVREFAGIRCLVVRCSVGHGQTWAEKKLAFCSVWFRWAPPGKTPGIKTSRYSFPRETQITTPWPVGSNIDRPTSRGGANETFSKALPILGKWVGKTQGVKKSKNHLVHRKIVRTLQSSRLVQKALKDGIINCQRDKWYIRI